MNILYFFGYFTSKEEIYLKTKDELKGNKDLYNQHCKLFQIRNEIQDIVNGDMDFEGFKKDDEITYLIHRFQDYYQYHFQFQRLL